MDMVFVKSLGLYHAAELVGGLYHGNGFRQATTRLYLVSCTKVGWRSLTQNRVLHQPLARSFHEGEFEFVAEDTCPSQERSKGLNGIFIPLRVTISREVGVLFDNHPQLKNQVFLLYITIVNPCASSNLKNLARCAGKHLADAVERGKSIGAHSRYLLPPSSRYFDVR